MIKIALFVICTFGCPSLSVNHFARFDGWYNNPSHPRWGSPGMKMLRSVPASYADSVYRNFNSEAGFPLSRTVSNALRGDEQIEPSFTDQSALLPFFTQLVVDDIVDSRRVACPAEYLNIELPESESSYDHIMPVYRAKFDRRTGSSPNAPRNMVNEVTSWLDASVIYGPSQSWSEHIREYQRGRLQAQANADGFPPFNTNGLPLINPTIDSSTDDVLTTRDPEQLLGFGNARGNENAFLMTMQVIWFRYHNFLAQRFAEQNPGWSDQKIFENVRKWVVATYQKVTLYEMLPVLIRNFTVPEYSGYNSLIDPSVSVEFSAAAMRIGHSMVPTGVVLRRPDCSSVNPLPDEFLGSAGEPALRLCNTYWQLQDTIVSRGIDDIVLGMVSQTTNNHGYTISDDLRNFLYGPIKRPRMDLLAVTIERGRDSGLASYNRVRKANDLDEISSFAQFTGVPESVLGRIAEVYQNDTDRLELYVGGLLESGGAANGVGSLFSKIIVDQFVRLRDSDRFWFENTKDGFFNATQIGQIRNTTFRDIILATTGLQDTILQENVFLTEGSVCPSATVQPTNFTRPCSPNRGKNLFDGYWDKFAGTIILLLLFPTISYVTMLAKARFNEKKMIKEKKRIGKQIRKQSVMMFSTTPGEILNESTFSGFEIIGKNKNRPVVILMEEDNLKILNMSGRILRMMNLGKFIRVYLLYSDNKRNNMMVIRVPKEYDVVIRFNTHEERDRAKETVTNYLKNKNIDVATFAMSERTLLSESVTQEVRQQLLEASFRRIFAEILNIKPKPERRKSFLPLISSKKRLHDHIIDCELTELEFADILGMKADSLFVKRMFELADTDRSGYLSMREFADLIVLLMNGSPEAKAKMLFDMYDVDSSGEVTREEGKMMIKSFFEVASYKIAGSEVEKMMDVMFRSSVSENENEGLTLEKFTEVLLQGNADALASAKLELPGLNLPAATRRNALTFDSGASLKRRLSGMEKKRGQADPKNTEYRSVINSTAARSKEGTGWRRYLQLLKRYVENYRRHIMCLAVFYTVTIAVMVERATHYALKTEHKGIRQVTEWGLIISRSAAAAISFHYSFILLTMCRNLITFCRETFLNNFIPFDAAVGFHKQIAYVAVVETGLHVFGHLSNFYHLSVHPLPILACVFPTILVDDGSDLPKSFVWWVYQTITGATGILLVAVLSIIYVFATQYSRRYCFRVFWITHHIFIVLLILIILHGSVGLIQSPLFHFYLAVPAFIFTIDQLITLSRSKIQTSVVKADPLPSGVTNLIFKRPIGFDYLPGQWVKIACLSLGTNEYHPFTLTSAPHEEHLSLHIRAVGPWTTNLRSTYQEAIDHKSPYPKLYLDGPFGEGHQDWYKYEVSVLVGAGIGVTPFTSILKDIVHKCKSNKSERIACKKVYFIWVTRTQKHFEWLTDIIQELEESDVNNMVDTHIYITQFQDKFDLRTTVLYICERFFQKEANQSLFTGLQAMTHFGRPQFRSFFKSLQEIHGNVNRFGVFSCGPPGLTNEVESSSKDINRRGKSQFMHFFENF